MGYRRLTWQMVDVDVAYLRPHQVYRTLKAHYLSRRAPRPAPEGLRRPPEPNYPDQVWHVDLMYLSIAWRSYYLVDIVDSYSRFLVHWRLHLTLRAHRVTETVQEALERLPVRRPGEPRVVHDRGSQFLSAEWRAFVAGAHVTDIVTRVQHPQYNGRVERLHRTHREEGLPEELLTDYHQASAMMAEWAHYYNYHRPHSALGYLCPGDYYRGDPKARPAAREEKLARALQEREAYWEAH